MQESARKTANEVLRNKPQQRNVTDSSDSSTADLSRTVLQKYVKKLLAMSRTSIENLQVSTVSEVSTPSGSVIEVASNKPDKFLLKHILNTLNMSKREAEQHFQEVPPNSLDSINYYTDTESTTLTSSVSSVGKVVKTKNVADTKEIPGETNSQTTMMAKYEEIAETCSRRISNLTAMIEQVRLEKERILHSPNSTSEKEQSTSYLDIPQKKPEETEESLNDLSEKIIEIDENLVKTLKTMSESHIKEAFTVQCETQTPREEEEDIIVTRFKKLLSSSDEKSNSPSKDDRQLDFVPLLFDIPKLPKLETSSEPETPTSRIRRPPPAKGLLVAKKFNGDITAVPHELSTIVEAESQVSTRVQQSDGSDPKLSSPASQKQKSTSREEVSR